MKKKFHGERKKVPNMCKSCAYRINGDVDETAKTVRYLNEVSEKSHLAYLVLARILQDQNGGRCPKEAKEDVGDWCKDKCEDTGDEHHKFYLCWAQYITQVASGYSIGGE